MYKFVVIAATIFASATSQAQTSKGVSYTTLGPVLGMGHSWISNTSTVFNPTVQVGIAVIHSNNEHWGIGGINTISREGYSYELIRNGRLYTNSINPVYMRMVPRAYYFFGRYQDKMRLNLYAGPSLGVKLSEERHIDAGLPVGDYVLYANNNEFNTLDLGVNTGVGLNFKVARRAWLNVDGEYYLGLTNANIYGDQNRSLRTNVSLMFGL